MSDRENLVNETVTQLTLADGRLEQTFAQYGIWSIDAGLGGH